MIEKINYPTRLLKVESRKQFDDFQLKLFESDTEHIKEINRSIDRVLSLHKKGEDKYSIELPDYFKDKLKNEELKTKVTSELTGYELRALTAVVGMAQMAKSSNFLYYQEDDHHAKFEFELGMLYKLMGINSSTYNKKSREQVKDALASLHYKEFMVPVTGEKDNRKKVGFKIVRLVQFIEAYKFLDQKEETTFLVQVDSCFFDYKSEKKQNTYFLLPGDINQKLRKAQKGRPNVSIELFVKHLYQAQHCSKNSKIEYYYNTLIQVMNLDRYKKNSHYSRIKKTIENAFRVAVEIGLVTKIDIVPGKYGNKKYVIQFSN
ncbi:MAG: hypothetical protein KTR26_01620 [Flammeovirgaceae bacterium]|nr:hypothetical protein [Flammeovirgaceae bacterium]